MPDQTRRNVERRRFIKEIAAAGMIGTGVGTSSVAQARDEQQVSAGRHHPLRVMSYNIHAGRGTDGVYDLQRVADVIRTVDPDIVALQEVDKEWSTRSNFDDQPELLSSWLDMNVKYTSSWDRPNTNGHQRRYGLAILSKYPILQSTAHSYYSQRRAGNPYYDQKFLEGRINAKGAHCWFYSVHADAWVLSINKEQQEQLIATASKREHPLILAGDFNARYGIGDNPRQITYEILNDAYVDVLRQTGDDEYTIPAPGRDGNRRRLDYIFTFGGIGIRDGKVVSLNPPSPSDHRPVVADLVLTRGENGQGSP